MKKIQSYGRLSQQRAELLLEQKTGHTEHEKRVRKNRVRDAIAKKSRKRNR